MAAVAELTDANFEDVISKSKQPVLAFFWASWSGPSKSMAPVVDKSATDYDGKVTFGKVDVDANRGTSARYGVSSLPNVLIFKDGKVFSQIQGLTTSEKIQTELDKALKG
jgi:thioredoxin 1